MLLICLLLMSWMMVFFLIFDFGVMFVVVVCVVWLR